MTTPKTLILLPCHSIWKFYEPVDECAPGTDPDEWSLASFQLVSQDQLTFMKHLEECVSLVNKDPESALFISGGATKADTGPVTEAQSYYYLGLKLNWINDANKSRVVLENFARDSMENILFSMVRFYQLYAKFPEKVIIVGMEFKRHRFLQNHTHFLGLHNVEYIGFDPVVSEANVGDDDFYASEIKNAVRHFDVDPCGIKSPLKDKKLKRDPFRNGAETNYLSICPNISLQDLYTDANLSKYYSKEDVEINADLLKLYKFITNH